MNEPIQKISLNQAKEEAKAQLLKEQVDKKNKLIAEYNNNLIVMEKTKINNKLSSDDCATYKNPPNQYINKNNKLELKIAEVDKMIEIYQNL